MHIYRGLISPDSVFQRYDIARVLIEPGSALATSLEGSPDWSEVYRDEKAIVFTRSQAT
jgi:hypothetical protein